IEKDVSALPGVIWAGANFASARIHVEFERGKTSLSDIRKVIEMHGVRTCAISPPSDDTVQERSPTSSTWAKWWNVHLRKVTTGLSFLFALLGLLTHGQISVYGYAAAIVIGGWSTARAAWMALRSRTIDMSVLMTVAVIGAMGIGEWFEGATVVVLFGLGNLLQAAAMERTRRSIRALMDLSPKTARVLHGRGEFDVPVEQVRLGDIVRVKPGERIPVDGEIISGNSAINEAPITGESVPVDKGPGDPVFAGTLNGQGAIEFRVTHVYRDTALARIIHRVEEAQAQRAPAQQMIDRFARHYTPVVVGLAIVVALVPPLASYVYHTLYHTAMPAGIWTTWFLRGLSLLIIACPCALVISTPVAIVTAIGSASRNGVLIKGGVYLEEAGSLRAMLYDKTGTLTEGRFRVDDVVPIDSLSCSEILDIATALEVHSEHPLAEAFLKAVRNGRERQLPEVRDFRAVPGQGVIGVLNGETYFLGNPNLLESSGIPLEPARAMLQLAEARGKTAVLLATKDRPIGIVLLSDVPRKDAAEAIAELEKLGVEFQAMLTGDNVHVAQDVANVAGLKEFKASLLPDQKQALVREYQWRYGKVGMVGDGINDAPALAAANVGIVMGAMGSDTAMETADIALMGDELSRLPYLIRLSRRTMAVIRQNIAFSLVTKAVLLVSAVFIGLPLWLAVLGDVGVSLLVTLNAMRLMDGRWAAATSPSTAPVP
ncbi:MAG TPA: cation-translocating P-type ATPase, partial [Chthonomonadales bacterium]|nr:cation-translocating P-type ATPase [Chthonomonadales bacterium]